MSGPFTDEPQLARLTRGRTRRCRRRRLSAAVGGITLLSAVPVSVAFSAVAKAETSGSLVAYAGQASAHAVYVRAAVPQFLIIENFVNGGGPSAQAAVDSLGSSSAFASFPNPGDLAIAFPGLAATLSGKPVPRYPFFVTSQYPSSPTKKVEQPGYVLDTTSEQASARGLARVGVSEDTGEQGASAVASVASVPEGFISTSESHVDFAAGPVVLNGVLSRAEVRVGADGATTKTSAMEIGSFSIAGVKVGVTDQGFELAGATIPSATIDPVTKALSVGDTTVRLVPASSTADSVLSQGLEITTPVKMPAPYDRTVLLEYTIGRAFAQATGVAGSPSGSAPIASGGGAPAGTSPDLDAAGLPSLPGTAPLTSGGVPRVEDLRNQTVPLVAGQSFLRGAGDAAALTSFFPILALGGAVLVTASLGAARLTK